MKLVNFLVVLFVLIGGLHIGLSGIMHIDLITTIFGGMTTLVYLLVTLSTLYVVFPMISKHLHTS